MQQGSKNEIFAENRIIINADQGQHRISHREAWERFLSEENDR